MNILDKIYIALVKYRKYIANGCMWLGVFFMFVVGPFCSCADHDIVAILMALLGFSVGMLGVFLMGQFK